MARLLKHPTNPTCGENNKTRDTGITRTLPDGRLQYLNPMTGTWEAAVRLEDIRDKILRQDDPSQYTFPKAHGNKFGKGPLNFTSFLLKDKDVGPERQNRPDILFQIRNTGQHTQKPTGYVMDEDRKVLDNFDHGLRDFSHLPKVLSTELAGEDIEYFYRQNGEVADYDLTARMPKSYWTGKGGNELRTEPPRTGTINQRAQRFRSRAALISWRNRAGTGTKNDHILSLIPYTCKAVNSTKGFRDLTQAELSTLNKQNKGKLSKRPRDAKDEALAKRADSHTSAGDATGSQALTAFSNERPTKRTRRNARTDDPDAGSINGKSLPKSTKAAKPRLTRTSHSAQASQIALDAALDPFSNIPHAQADIAQNGIIANGRTHTNAANSGRMRREATGGSRINAQRQEAPHSELTTFARTQRLSTTAPLNGREKQDMQGNVLKTSIPEPSQWKSSGVSSLTGGTSPPVTLFDLSSSDFKAQTEAGINGGDYRYIAPNGRFTDFGDQWAVNRALELTRIDMFEQIGQMPPNSMWANNRRKSYASQYCLIQELFNQIWKENGRAPPLFFLPEWCEGFEKWKTVNSRGQHLEAVMRETWGEVDAEREEGELH
ncbi:hypothetical protein N7G274_008391 [Stereocaulon virgatum]|uniref:Uncharacterized protein n=1 Tax=Stereocaulon virgatum TaxID=373712 RepID=A0ABR4A281_9LECA